MRILTFTIFLLTVASLSSSCVIGPHMTPGILFANHNGPITATSAKVGFKIGRKCAHGLFFGLITFGDNSVNGAARVRGITQISHVDYKTFNLLGIYYNTCTLVRGS